MWGYQAHFRISLEFKIKDVLEEIGVQTEPKVLLVGVRSLDSKNHNPVCVEPEDGSWSLSLFSGLLERVESEINSHPMQNVIFGDEPSMRDKPEDIRRDSVTRAVRQCFADYDVKEKVRSFCGAAYLVGEYYVVPVIQISEAVFDKYPSLKGISSEDLYTYQGHRSFIHACISEILSEAFEELCRPEPGRFLSRKRRTSSEIARSAARSFMYTPGIAVKGRSYYGDQFERFNLISSLMYEGTEGIGQLILAAPNTQAVEFVLRFKEAVPFREPRWARKILQMAAKETSLIADSEFIYGLGKLSINYDPSLQDIFIINFLDHYHWELCCGEQVFLQSHYGIPKLPQEPIDQGLFLTNYCRLFPKATPDDYELIWKILTTAICQDHGSMIVIAEDAEAEVSRLEKLGTSIEPTLMSEILFKRVSGIDGTIFLDPSGICHGIGIILDGSATSQCTPSRGSRFNSGVRYVQSSHVNRLAIIVSDDKTIDVIPKLRPQVSSTEIESNIAALGQSTLDSYHKPRNWLDENRFYLNDTQCERVNAALDRIESMPMNVGEYVIETPRFSTSQDMNETYLIP